MIAYEPVWAIGTGRNATPAQAGEAHAHIRARLRQWFGGTAADQCHILYGGSVKPENIRDLASLERRGRRARRRRQPRRPRLLRDRQPGFTSLTKSLRRLNDRARARAYPDTMRIACLVASLSLASFALQSAAPRAAARLELPATGVTVAMLDMGGRPMIDATINGKGPYHFILDTGADFPAVDAPVADALALPPGSTFHDASSVTIAELRIGDAIARGFVAARFEGMLGRNDPAGPSGILSAEGFAGTLVVLDYPGRRVRFVPGALPAADGKRIFEYGADEELPVIPVTVGGREVHIHLDSGSPGGIMLPLKYEPSCRSPRRRPRSGWLERWPEHSQSVPRGHRRRRRLVSIPSRSRRSRSAICGPGPSPASATSGRKSSRASSSQSTVRTGGSSSSAPETGAVLCGTPTDGDHWCA